MNNEPGVFSARYAGDERDNNKNIDLVLTKLESENNRMARFRTVVTLISDLETVQFEGIVSGTISSKRMGEKGFGYDPIFIPDGYNRSFAQMTVDKKNEISHRGIAFSRAIKYIQKRYAS